MDPQSGASPAAFPLPLCDVRGLASGGARYVRVADPAASVPGRVGRSAPRGAGPAVPGRSPDPGDQLLAWRDLNRRRRERPTTVEPLPRRDRAAAIRPPGTDAGSRLRRSLPARSRSGADRYHRHARLRQCSWPAPDQSHHHAYLRQCSWPAPAQVPSPRAPATASVIPNHRRALMSKWSTVPPEQSFAHAQRSARTRVASRHWQKEIWQ